MSINVYQRKDGRYEGRITTEKINGKRKYKAFFGKTTDEVIQKIKNFNFMSTFDHKTEKLFSDVYSEWFESILYRIKESTAANYTLKANKHILPTFGNQNISDISQISIYKFIKEKQDNGFSNRYITDILILMKSVFRFASHTYHIANSINEIIMPKKQKTEIRLLTKSEEQKLMQIINENQNLTTMGIILAKMTGLRIGELCALRWKDIDLEKRILTVNKTLQRIQCKNGKKFTKLELTDPKSETSKRVIPIPESIIALLKKFVGKTNEFILSGTEKPVEPRTLQYRFAKILKNGNLPSIHFHTLRHMFASKCIQLGFDVKSLSEILGHSSVEITLNRYVHSSFEQKSEFMNKLQLSC